MVQVLFEFSSLLFRQFRQSKCLFCFHCWMGLADVSKCAQNSNNTWCSEFSKQSFEIKLTAPWVIFFVGYSKSLVTAADEDKEAFFTLFNKFLWNDEEQDEEGRQYFRRQGILRRPMPMMFKQQNNVAGSMYRNFSDQCYGLLCSLGLKGLARTLLQLTLWRWLIL